MTRRIYLIEGDRQWISNGYCATPIIGLPKVNEGNIYRLLSLDDQSDKYTFLTRNIDLISEDDVTSDDLLAYPQRTNIERNGVMLKCFKTDKGIITVNSDILKLFSTNGFQNYAIRGNMLAVFDGLILDGYISPFRLTEEAADDIEEIAQGLRYAERQLFVGNEGNKGIDQIELEEE